MFTCLWPKRSGDSGDCQLEVGGWREGDLLFCLQGGERTASKDKDEKEKRKKEKKKRSRWEGTGKTVEVKNNESVDKICHEPKNKWLKLYER